MGRSFVYIGIRAAQFVFAIIVIGLAGFLLTDIKKQTSLAGLPSLTGSIPGISDATISSILDSFSQIGDGSSSSGSSSATSSNSPMSAKMKRSVLLTRSPKSKGKKASKAAYSSGSDDSSTPMKYTVPLNMLIAVSVFTLLTAIASSVLNFLWPAWAPLVFWGFLGWDIFLTILWIVGAGLTGKFLTQNDGWKATYKQANLFKACFALAFIFMLSFIGTAVLTFLMCWTERKKAQQEAGVETPPAPVNPAGVPVDEKSPPVYVDQQQVPQQQFYEPQQHQQLPYEPAVSPNPPEAQYQPAMSPQPYQPTVSPLGPSMSPPPPATQQPGYYQQG